MSNKITMEETGVEFDVSFGDVLYLKGDKGDKGDPGEKGDKGDPGEKGDTPSLDGYVKDTQFADKNGNAGITRTKSIYGISSGRYDENSPVTGDTLTIARATDTDIKGRTNTYKPIVPSNLDYAVKMALTNPKIEWTEEEKQAVRKLLGVSKSDYLLEDCVLNGSPIDMTDTGRLVDDDKYILRYVSARYFGNVMVHDVEATVSTQPITPDFTAKCVKWKYEHMESEGVYDWIVMYNDPYSNSVHFGVWNGADSIAFTPCDAECIGDIVTLKKV